MRPNLFAKLRIIVTKDKPKMKMKMKMYSKLKLKLKLKLKKLMMMLMIYSILKYLNQLNKLKKMAIERNNTGVMIVMKELAIKNMAMKMRKMMKITKKYLY